MKPFLYIIAEEVEPQVSFQRVSFRHVMIDAQNEDDAYAVGYATIRQLGDNGLKFLNNYVIELP